MNRNEVLSYHEMCTRERLSLQRGMNYRAGKVYSIILMSQRPNAPYEDSISEDGKVLIYEGHDVPKGKLCKEPKKFDQPEFLPSGNLTENGKFNKAVLDNKLGLRKPEIVRVYEKIRDGIWSYNGRFELVDAWVQSDGKRKVFKFKLQALEDAEDETEEQPHELFHARLIPTHVKLAVWKRDGGKCVVCGSQDNLHFDHVIPFSKGGASISAANVQLMCMRHNLEKHAKII